MSFFNLFLGALAADQGSKYAIRKKLEESPKGKDLLGGKLRINHLENPGLAGGYLKEKPDLVKGITIGTTAAFLLSSLGFFRGANGVEKTGLSLLMAGTAGNAADRLRFGKVTDFIQFPKIPHKKISRMVFNLADFMLFFGWILLVLGSIPKLFVKKK